MNITSNLTSKSTRLNDWLWHTVNKSTDTRPESVCVFRIVTGLFLLILYSPNFGWIGQMPQNFFAPPLFSFAALAKGFPDSRLLLISDLILVLCAFCIVAGIKARAATLLYVMLSIFCLHFQYSFGKIDHSIMLYVLLCCMAFSGWGTRLALVPDKPSRFDSTSKSFALLGVLICFAFFSAGCAKALHWINFDFNKSGSAQWFYWGYYNLKRTYLLAPYITHLPFSYFKILDFSAVAFEISAVLFLLHSAAAWRTYLLIICSFHLMNTLILNIPFLQNSLLVLAFIDYSSTYTRLSRISRQKAGLFLLLSGLCIVPFRWYNACNFILSTIIFIPDDHVEAGLYVSAVIWLLVILLMLRNLWKEKKGVKLEYAGQKGI